MKHLGVQVASEFRC